MGERGVRGREGQNEAGRGREGYVCLCVCVYGRKGERRDGVIE